MSDVNKVQADNNSIAIGNLSAGGNIGDVNIQTGYTAEQVAILIAQIQSTFQPKPFDGRCPYKGLDVFEEEDAELFFGRETLVDDLVSRVKNSRTVFVTGPSGSGKSSLVRAGLIHALKQGQVKGSDRWLYTTMKPGRDPIGELGRVVSSLASSTNPEDEIRAKAMMDATIFARWCEIALKEGRDKRLVLFIDQFEEVFTQISKEEERVAFLNLLTHSATIENGRVIILFSMRSDFVSNCATYPQLNALLNQQFVQIGAMQPEELVSAIAQPALRVGLRIDPDLIAQIINEMKGEPGALPLMQFALKDLFDSQQEKSGLIALTLNDYLQRGGIHKALEHHADDSFSKLSKDEQELARSIFSGLIEIGRGTQDTKRTALFDELVPANTKAEDVEAIVQKLADARLITTDEAAGKDTVTISHEKLIDAWPWLKKLINENRDAITLQNEIMDAAKEWEENKRDASYLYSGGRLANIWEQVQKQRLALGQLAQEFVKAGRRRQQQARVTLISTVSLVLIAAILASIVFQNQAQANIKIANTAQAANAEAIAQKATAQASADISLARYLSNKASDLASTDLPLSLLLSAEAVRSFNSAETYGVLFDNLRKALKAIEYRDVSTLREAFPFACGLGNQLSYQGVKAALSPDGQIMAVGQDYGSIDLIDQTSQNVLGQLQTSSTLPVTALAFNKSGSKLAAGTDDGSLSIWDIVTQKLILSQQDELYLDYISSLSFSNDGNYIAISGSTDNIIEIFDINQNQIVGQLAQHTREINCLQFSQDDSLLASAGNDNFATVWSWKDRENFNFVTLNGISNSVSLGFNQTGDELTSINSSGMTTTWGVADNDNMIYQNLECDGGGFLLSHDGKLLVCKDLTTPIIEGKASDYFKVIDISTKLTVGNIVLPEYTSNQILASDQSDHVLVYENQSGALTLWDILTQQPVGKSVEPQKDVTAASFNPDGKTLALGYTTGQISLWDVKSQKQIIVFQASPRSILKVVFNYNGSLLLSVDADGTVTTWDAKSGKSKNSPLKSNGVMALSPVSNILVYGDPDGTPILFDLEKFAQAEKQITDKYDAQDLSFNSDGSILAIAGFDNSQPNKIPGYQSVSLWDIANNGQIGSPINNVIQGDGAFSELDTTFSPDGNKMIISDNWGHISIWEVNTEAWRNRACQIAGRNLTHSEWNFYLQNREYPTRQEEAACPQWPLEPEVIATSTAP